jgi:toxin HigB-1
LGVNDIYTIFLSKQVLEELKKIPIHIVIKLEAWIDAVVNCGLSAIKKKRGYYSEPLQGNRIGQYAIKLDKTYRAIYVIEKNKSIRFVEILQVSAL